MTSTVYKNDEQIWDNAIDVICHLGYGTIEELGAGDWFGNLQYLRPVVALDSKTTVNQVSIIGEIENPTWTWYDVCGKQAGS